MDPPNRFNLHPNIKSWNSEFPSIVPEDPGSLKKEVCFNYCLILEFVWSPTATWNSQIDSIHIQI